MSGLHQQKQNADGAKKAHSVCVLKC